MTNDEKMRGASIPSWGAHLRPGWGPFAGNRFQEGVVGVFENELSFGCMGLRLRVRFGGDWEKVYNYGVR
jgi:hypothetical protein